MAQAFDEVCSDSSYYSDNASFIDDNNMQNEYNKMCETSIKIILNNKGIKSIKNS